MSTSFIKDPSGDLDWAWQWSAWLAPGETISSATVLVPAGLTKSKTETVTTDGLVTVWLSGGEVGSTYRVTCRVVTNQGRTDDRSSVIRVMDR